MSILTVRDLDPDIKAKLRERAARHGRSMEAEARSILTEAVTRASEPTDLVAAIRDHFGDAAVRLELPDRRGQTQRPIDFADDHS